MAQDALLVRDCFLVLVKWDAKSHTRAAAMKVKARAMANLVPDLEVGVKSRETELEASWDTIKELEDRVDDRKVKATKREELFYDLENRLANSTTMVLHQDEELHALWM